MKRFLLLLTVLIVPLCLHSQPVSFADGVEFSGWPSYVSEFQTAFRDNGGPLSPWGSHFGLKAEVRELEFAGVEHYACMTGRNRFDYSRTGLVGVSSMRFEVNGEELKPEERKITFEQFGWRETSTSGDYIVTTTVGFPELNRYFIGVSFENTSSKVVTIKPVFHFDGRAKILRLNSHDSAASISFSVQPLTSMGVTHLAVTSTDSFDTAGLVKGKGFELSCEEFTVPAGVGYTAAYIFAFSPDDVEKAVQSAKSGLREFSSIDKSWVDVQAKTSSFLGALPVPHLENDSHEVVYKMSALGLENQLYAPRNNMEHWAVVPTKVHYNWFWLWDSGLQSLGYANYQPERSKDAVLTMFDAQQDNGFIAHMTDEQMKSLTPHSQAPVFGYAVQKQLYRSGPDLQYIEEMYTKSSGFIDWWRDHRDVNRNGLFEWLSQDEGGWDDSPRMNYVKPIVFISYYGSLGELIASRTKPLDAVDLNAWMYAYFEAMAEWADELGRTDESTLWRAQAEDLAHLIDNELWDQECGCWLDTWSGPGKDERTSFRVLTPHIWFPAFTGATRDEDKARRVIKEHLLNPDEFFGKYPIPTVAYNDPYFDVSKNTWKGSIWLITAYSALEALFRFGYEEEAMELKERLLNMMADQDGMMGIYETYCPLTGKYKTEGTTDSYSSAQFGWSCAFTMEMALDRFQEKRYVFERDKVIHGFIRKAEVFESRDEFFEIDAGQAVPHVRLWANDSLLKAKEIKLELSDPYKKLDQDKYKVTVKGKEYSIQVGKPLRIDLN